ncbi:FKBP-type peptidyl-prolyl cis-trans isomerase [Gilvimarinus sp. F26214L]|uniref:FKBP-type peptidyl-prolyl cis-trans isomerase n=1 Tax=Gilvimarinus sp. DZF01 TaxID=3461371 RepID=UPI00404615B5
MSQAISDNSVVNIHYELTDDEGNVLDSSKGSEPLAYLHGAGNIIPGLEKALAGKTSEDSFKVRIEPGEGYGEVMPELIQTLPRSVFQGVDSVEVGMNFEAQAPDGQVQRVRVKDVDGDEVTIDANHPLAGVALNFDIDVVEVRDATEEEIAHGHVH